MPSRHARQQRRRPESLSSIALRFVSIGSFMSGPWVGARVHRLRHFDSTRGMSGSCSRRRGSSSWIDLQIGPALQEVGCKGVSQRVRRDAALESGPARLSPSRRRTSEVDSQRPLFERNSARSPSSPDASAGLARSDSARAPSKRARRRARRASCRPCPPRTSSASGSIASRPGPRAPVPADPQSRRNSNRARSRTSSGPAAGTRSSSSVTSLSRSTRGRYESRRGVTPRGRQVGLDLAALDELSIERADRGQLAADRGARRAALGRGAREPAQLAVAEVGGLQAATAHSESWRRGRPRARRSLASRACAARRRTRSGRLPK